MICVGQAKGNLSPHGWTLHQKKAKSDTQQALDAQPDPEIADGVSRPSGVCCNHGD